MSKKERTVRYTAEELRRRLAQAPFTPPPEPTDEKIERAAREDPDDDLSIDWTKDVIVEPPRNKSGVFLRLDPKVLEHFRAEGPGYQTRINAVLRAYVEAQAKRKRAS